MYSNYYFFDYYVDYEEISFKNMISKKDFDDFVERSKNNMTEEMFYKTFLLSRWKSDE